MSERTSPGERTRPPVRPAPTDADLADRPPRLDSRPLPALQAAIGGQPGRPPALRLPLSIGAVAALNGRIGNQAVQRLLREQAPSPRERGLIQRAEERKKTLGTRGAIIGGILGTLLLPVIGTIIGAVVGQKIGQWLAEPVIYNNLHATQLQSEQAGFETFRQQHAHERDLYSRGAIIHYSAATARDFHALVGQGMLLYTYDVDGLLSIGTPTENKHAVVAGGEQVLAAGTAQLQYTADEQQFLQYQEYVSRWQAAQEELAAIAPQVERYNELLEEIRATVPRADDHRAIVARLQERAPDAVPIYRKWVEAAQKVEGYKTWLDEEAPHTKLDMPDPRGQRDRPLLLTNDSGHYRPGPNSEHEAREAWKGVGYNNLLWSGVRTR